MSKSNRKLLMFMLLLAMSISLEIQNQIQTSDNPNFIQNIWKQIQATGIEDEILNTSFMQGIKSGKLDPMCFARYLVQDIYYMTQSVKLWDRACFDGRNDPKFLQYCNKFNKGEHNYEHFLKEQMFLSSAQPLDEVRKYMQDKINTYEQKTYQYIGIINYACYKVYSSITKKILPQTNQQSAYFPWVQFNSSQSQYEVLQQFINSYQNFYYREEIKDLILKFTKHELNFFKESCPFQQKPLSFISQ